MWLKSNFVTSETHRVYEIDWDCGDVGVDGFLHPHDVRDAIDAVVKLSAQTKTMNDIDDELTFGLCLTIEGVCIEISYDIVGYFLLFIPVNCQNDDEVLEATFDAMFNFGGENLEAWLRHCHRIGKGRHGDD